MALPEITITFRKLAEDIVKRSQRGIVALLLEDSTSTEVKTIISRAGDIDATKWTAANAALIKLAFSSGANKVVVLRLTKTESTINYDTEIDKIVPMKWNWLTAPGADAAGVAAIVTKIKALRADGKTYKAVLANAAAPDSEGIVNFCQTGSITSDCEGTSAEMTAGAYTVRLAGIFAGLPLDQSALGVAFTDISALTETTAPGTDAAAGKLVMVNNGENYELASAITSLTTTSASAPEDFKKIKLVEAADMIAEDITAIWRAGYRGKKNNDYAGKQSLMAELTAYLKGIAGTALSPDYANAAMIDTDAQSAYLTDAGKDVSLMTDVQIAHADTGDKVFAKCDIKLIDAMESISMSVVLQ